MPYATLRDKKTELIRKARDGSVFVASSAATTIGALTTGAGSDLTALPTGYEDLGWTSTDGVSFDRTTNTSQVKSFGSVEPTREDITEDIITMAVTAQETKLTTIELYTGADLSAAQAGHITSEFSVAKPSRPGYRYSRVLALFVDDGDLGEIYMARYMPRARITAFGQQQFNDSDNPVQYQMTWTGFEDSTLGYSHKWLWGGPGWAALLTSMGITQASS